MKLRHERGSLADKNKALKLIVFSIIVLIIISAIICVAFGKETYSKKLFSGSNSKANASKNTTTYVWIFDDAEKYGGTKKITGLLDLDSEIKYNDGTYSYKIINWKDVAAKLDIPKREHYKFEGYYRDNGEKNMTKKDIPWQVVVVDGTQQLRLIAGKILTTNCLVHGKPKNILLLNGCRLLL